MLLIGHIAFRCQRIKMCIFTRNFYAGANIQQESIRSIVFYMANLLVNTACKSGPKHACLVDIETISIAQYFLEKATKA